MEWSPNPTVVDDQQKHVVVCNGIIVLELDAHAASMTRRDDRQRRKKICQRDKRTTIEVRQH